MTRLCAVRRPLSLRLAGASSAICLTACVFAAEPPADAAGVRLLVKLAKPSDDAAAVAAAAMRVAGVPVRHAATVSPAWHALVLTCVSPAACAAATERLREAHDDYESVEIDGRRRAQ